MSSGSSLVNGAMREPSAAGSMTSVSVTIAGGGAELAWDWPESGERAVAPEESVMSDSVPEVGCCWLKATGLRTCTTRCRKEGVALKMPEMGLGCLEEKTAVVGGGGVVGGEEARAGGGAPLPLLLMLLREGGLATRGTPRPDDGAPSLDWPRIIIEVLNDN